MKIICTIVLGGLGGWVLSSAGYGINSTMFWVCVLPWSVGVVVFLELFSGDDWK